VVRIPQVISQRDISVTPTAPLQQPGTFTQAARATEQAGRALQQITDAFQRLRDTKEVLMAETEFTKRINNLRFQVENLDDPLLMEPTFAKGAEKIKQDTASMIGNSNLRGAFELQSDSDISGQSLTVNRKARQIEIQQSLVILDENIKQNRIAFLVEQNPLERTKFKIKIERNIDAMADAKGLSGEAAEVFKRTKLEALGVDEVDVDIENKPEFALDELLKGERGIYKDLRKDLRDEKIKKARDKIKLNDQIRKELFDRNVETNERAMTKRILNGEVIPQTELNDARLALAAKLPGAISKDYITAVEKRQNKAKIKRSAFEQASAYIDINKEFDKFNIKSTKFAGDTTLEDVQKIRSKIAIAEADGFISIGEYQTFMNKLEFAFDNRLDETAQARMAKDRNMFDNISLFITGNLGRVKELDEQTKNLIKRDIRRKLDLEIEAIGLDQEITDENVAEISQKIKNDILQQNSEFLSPNANQYKIGDMAPTVFGLRKVVGIFPNGDPDIELSPAEIKIIEKRIGIKVIR